MIERIRLALHDCGVENWLLKEIRTESGELFFVKRELDTRRIKDTLKYALTLFTDGEKNGKKTRGSTSVELLSSMTDSELRTAIDGAKYASGFAQNPFYELPDAERGETVRKQGALAEDPLAVSLGKMTEALFAPDVRADAFLNSAELFAVRKSVRILSSKGADVSWTDARIEGEFVVQCKEPEDVEMHNRFAYDECDTEALKARVEEALTFVCDRAKAQKVLKSGKYDLILTGEQLATVLSYYPSRAEASMLYAGYSTWKVGDDVQGKCKGEKLDLTLCATEPYSAEGIPMKDLPFLCGGKLTAVHGNNRFCRYLGVRPTGEYEKLRCENRGKVPFAEMKKKPCLLAVTFSDFQMDEFTSRFGGEIRLAYLIDGEKVTAVTGGSVNGSLLELQGNLVFSEETFRNAEYEGPYAALFTGVSVAGTEGENA